MYFNCQSIVPKFDELVCLCSANSPSIVCLTETWLCSDILDSELHIPNYNIVRQDRNRHGGGVAIYAKNALSFQVLLCGPSDLELIVISLQTGRHGNTCVGVFIDHRHHHLLFLILFQTVYFLLTILIFLILYC